MTAPKRVSSSADAHAAPLAAAARQFNSYANIYPPPWGQFALLLEGVRAHLAETGSGTLRQWVEAQARAHNLPAHRMWQYLAAANAWRRVAAGHTGLPALPGVETRLSPQMVILLDRLRLAGDDAMLLATLRQALEGRLSAAGLTRQLQQLPSARAATDRADQARGAILAALDRQAADWAGEGIYRPHLDVAVSGSVRPVDLVAAMERDGNLTFHAALVPDDSRPVQPAEAAALQPYFETLWLVLPPRRVPAETVGMPRQMGLLVWRDGHLRLLRRAVPAAPPRATETARAFLAP